MLKLYFTLTCAPAAHPAPVPPSSLDRTGYKVTFWDHRVHSLKNVPCLNNPTGQKISAAELYMSGCQWGDMWWLYKSSAVLQATGWEHKPVDPGAGYQTLPGKKEEKPSGSFYYGHLEVVNSPELHWETWASVLLSWYHDIFITPSFTRYFSGSVWCRGEVCAARPDSVCCINWFH